MPDIITLADAITAEINTGTFSRSIAATRSLMPEFDLAELSDLKVTVVPKAVDFAPFSRQYTQYDYSIDIGIQKKLSGDIETEMPPMLGLVDEIVTFLRKRKLADMPAAAWIKCTNDPVYARDHLAQSRVFTSVITVTYRMVAQC